MRLLGRILNAIFGLLFPVDLGVLGNMSTFLSTDPNSPPSLTTLEDSPKSCSRPSFEFLVKCGRVVGELPMNGHVIALDGLNPS